jgi:hypothetical protein
MDWDAENMLRIFELGLRNKDELFFCFHWKCTSVIVSTRYKCYSDSRLF